MTRFAVETQTAALVATRLTADLDADAFEDLWQRFEILFDVMCPPPVVTAAEE